MFVRVMRLPEVTHVTGLSGSTISDGVKAGTFPRPLQLGPKAVGWKEADIAEWLSSRPAVSQHR
jgi:prophage regulatory protein